MKHTIMQTSLEFFREMLLQAMQKCKTQVSEDIECYLVHLLNRFVYVNNVFIQDKNGQFKVEPLALIFKEAIETDNLTNRVALFQHIGDLALYFSGFFRENLQRRSVSVSYYVSMGQIAYSNVATLKTDVKSKETFENLSQQMTLLIKVLAEMKKQTLIVPVDQNQLQNYISDFDKKKILVDFTYTKKKFQ